MAELVEFDGQAKQITVLPGVTSLSVRNDLYSAWKRWLTVDDNSKYPQAFRVIGGDPVGGGQFAGDLYFLMNGWQVVVNEYLQVNGILYQDEAGVNTYNVQPGGAVIASVSSLAQSIETAVPVVTGDTSEIPAAVWAVMNDMEHAPSGSMGELIRSIGADSAATLSTTESMDSSLSEIEDTVSGLQTNVTSVLANLGTVTELVNILLKYSYNRTKIDSQAFTMTVFDDDGSTPLKVFDLKNITGQPSVTQVAERRPR